MPKKRPIVPLMLWRPHEPVYPKLIKTVIDGLSIEETKEMRKRGLALPALTKLGSFSLLMCSYDCYAYSVFGCTLIWKLHVAAKNGYYASLVPMVRDAFLTEELVRIDCQGLEKSDFKKIGCKLRVNI